MSKNANQCKGCGGELSYSPEKEGLVCSHCNSFIALPKDEVEIQKKDISQATVIEEAKDQQVQFLCPTCGRIHLGDGNLEKSICPYCGYEDTQKKSDFKYVQDGIVPLRVPEKEAKEKFKTWISKRFFAPSALKKQAKIGSFNAYYAPAWVYDFDVETTYSGVGITTTSNSKGETTEIRKEFKGKRKTQYKDYIQFATTYSSRYIENCLGYYGTHKLSLFDNRFTYGHEVKDVKLDMQPAWKQVIKDVKVEEEEAIKQFEGYERYPVFKADSVYLNPKYALYYLPVYEINYEYKGKLYSCFINGYSGKIEGKAPLSALKIGLTIGLGFLAFFILFIIFMLT